MFYFTRLHVTNEATVAGESTTASIAISPCPVTVHVVVEAAALSIVPMATAVIVAGADHVALISTVSRHAFVALGSIPQPCRRLLALTQTCDTALWTEQSLGTARGSGAVRIARGPVIILLALTNGCGTAQNACPSTTAYNIVAGRACEGTTFPDVAIYTRTALKA